MNKIFVHALLPYFDHESYSLSAYEQFFDKVTDFYKLIYKNYPTSEIVFILNHAWELTQSDQLSLLNDFFNLKFKSLGINYFLVYSVSLDSDIFPSNILKYNFFQNKVVHSALSNNHPVSENWNNLEFRCLFLTGKPDKFQRAYPLYKLYSAGLVNLNNMEWSFHYNDSHIQPIMNLLGISRADAEKFAQTVERNPDNIDLKKYIESFDYNGIPYDHTLYANTSWSAVSETTTLPHATWLTEKSYRPLLNMHPFIFFAQPGSEKYLTSMGFKTFGYCYPYNYDEILDDNERFSKAVENIVFLKERWKTLDHDKILSDVTYNRNLIYKNYSKEQKTLIKTIGFKSGDNVCDIDTYYNTGFVNNPSENIINYDWF